MIAKSRIVVKLILLVCFFNNEQIFSQTDKENTSLKFGISLEYLELIDKLVTNNIDSGSIPGANVLVYRRGGIVYNKSFGYLDSEKKTPLNKETIFRIASMSKTITAAAIMKLYEEGKILLSDRVDKYIPDFKDVKVIVEDSTDEEGNIINYHLVKAKNQLTIYHLLTHTAGIPYSFYESNLLSLVYREAGVNDGVLTSKLTIEENVKLIAAQPLLFEPGTKWEYGLSSDVLGYLIEVVSGFNLEDYLKLNIFNPLGMRDTYLRLPQNKKNRLIPLYSIDSNKKIRKLSGNPTEINKFRVSPDFPYNRNNNLLSGGGGMVSTVADYYNFCLMLLNHGIFNNKRVLSKKSVDMMTTMLVDHDIGLKGYKYGLGLGVRVEPGLSSVGEFFWGGIFYTRFFVDPKEELIIIFMSQLYPFYLLDLHKKIQAIVYHSLTN